MGFDLYRDITKLVRIRVALLSNLHLPEFRLPRTGVSVTPVFSAAQEDKHPGGPKVESTKCLGFESGSKSPDRALNGESVTLRRSGKVLAIKAE